MTLSKWLPLSLFVAAVIVAWYLAQPPKGAPPQSIAPDNLMRGSMPGDPMNDAIDRKQLIPNRQIVTPPEPIKFSDDLRAR